MFVRFSRATAKIAAADDAVITMRNGHPTLMLRVISRRVTIMSNASARLFVLLAEQTAEGLTFRRIHELHLLQSYLPLFIMPWTLMHVIDEESPLHGHDIHSLTKDDVRLFLTIEARDHALSAVVQDVKDYSPEHIRFGMRFANMVSRDDAGGTTADLARISVLEPDEGGA
jgi:inward rectifier potassium channel